MKKTALIIAAIVLATHLTYQYYSSGDFYFPDSYTYLTPALNLLHGHGFSYEDTPETVRTPGYPAFLLPFLALRAPDWSIVLVQHILDALLGAAIYLLARRAGAPRAVAIAGALVLAFDLVTIHFANKILTETLSAVVVFVIFVILQDRPRLSVLIAVGILCGALVLIRPVAIAYFVVIALWLAYVRVRMRAIAAFVVAALVLPLAWATRNENETGHFTVSAIGAMNLLLHRAGGAMAIEDGGDFDDAHDRRIDELLKLVNARIREGEGEDPDNVNSADAAPYYVELARPILLQHWRGAILVTIRGFYVNMFDTDWEAFGIVSSLDEDLVEDAVIAWTWALWIATIAGLSMLWRRDRAAALLIAGTILYFIFMAAGGESEGRFRTPVVPLMAVAVTSLFRSPRRYSTSLPTSSRASRRTESR